MLVSTLDYSSYLGRIGIGRRVKRADHGKCEPEDVVMLLHRRQRNPETDQIKDGHADGTKEYDDKKDFYSHRKTQQ